MTAMMRGTTMTAAGGIARARFGIALIVAVLVSGCGLVRRDDGPTLRVADQLDQEEATLAAAHAAQPGDYRIEWSNFVGGPLIIAAETGGSVDVGWMAETPLVYAQAAGSPVKVVAVSRTMLAGGSNTGLVVLAGSPIRTIADLRGRKVGYIPGTVAQYLVARALAGAHLSLADIVTVPVTGYNPAMLHGRVDALVTSEPLLSQSLSTHEIRVLAFGGQPYTPGFGYLVAANAALADPVKARLIGEFIQRLARATAWTRDHVGQAAPVIAKSYDVAPQVMTTILRRTPTRFAPIDPAVVAAQQQEADMFFKLGLIRHKVDASKLFDHRYDPLIAPVEAR